MRLLRAACATESLKLRRSRLPLFTLLGFSIAPLVGGLFMMILKDPERARSMGLIGAKAQITAGTADWPTFLGMLNASMAIGGFILFGIVIAWVFGREHSDGTMKDLLALPTPRWKIVIAKYLVVAGWCLFLSAWIFGLGLVIATAVSIPGWSANLLSAAAVKYSVTSILTVLLVTPLALAAGLGRGYIAPLTMMILAMMSAQIVAALGWGQFFPWSVPAIYSGMAGSAGGTVGVVGFLAVSITSVAGVAATTYWWQHADHI